MNAGKYNKLITIVKKQLEINEFKDAIIQAEDIVMQCYAYVNNLSGSEYWSALQNNAENSVVFTIRYNSKSKDIDPLEHDILFEEKLYNILSVDNFQYLNKDIKLKAMRKGVGYEY